ncbi:MAG: glycosyltransferase family 9 protein [Nitrospinota bacterium]
MITPALRSLKKRFPEAQIDLLVQFGVAPLAETFPNIHCIHSLPCGFLLRGGRRLAGVAAWFLKLFELRRNEYNLIIDFMGLFHSAAAAWMSRAPLRIGHRRDISLGYISLSTFGHFYTHEICSEKEDHLADQMALLPAALGAPIDREGWEVVITAEMEKAAASRLHLDGADSEKGPFVLIHPGAKWPPRRWPPEIFAKTIDILHGKGIRAILNAGPGEEAIIEAIRHHCDSNPIYLWPPVPLDTLWGMLKLSAAYLGNESGPMHMAGAAGTPVVSIFGPTQPQRVGPRGSPFIPIYSALECSPCQPYFTGEKCHRGHNYCMDEITPADAAAIERLINK